MSTFTINSTPSPIFPDGLQEPMVIFNKGPYTVYVDSDSSVSGATSIPLPPLGELAWDAQRPLWAVTQKLTLISPTISGDFVSQVNITRNSNAPIYSYAADALLFKTSVLIDNNGNNFDTPAALEVASYETVKIGIFNPTFNIAAGSPFTTTQEWTVDLFWLDGSGVEIAHDTFNAPTGSNQVPAAGPFIGTPSLTDDRITKIVVPVRGRYLIVGIGTNNANPSHSLTTISVVASSTPAAQRMTFGVYDALPHATIPAVILGYLTSDSVEMNMGTTANNFCDLYLPALKPNVTLIFNWGGAPVTAGILGIRNAWDPSYAEAANVSIPLVANSQAVADFPIPLTRPIKLQWITIPQTAGPVNMANLYMKILWHD